MLILKSEGIYCFTGAKIINWLEIWLLYTHQAFVCGDPSLYGWRLGASYISGVPPVEAKC